MNIEALQLWSAVVAGDVARRMGLLSVLCEGDATAEEVARQCGLDVRGCQAVLDSLASFGLVEAVNGHRYRAPALVDHVERALVSIPGRLRGEPPGIPHDEVDGASQAYPTSAPLLVKLYGEQPAQAAAQLRGSEAVLDLGAGTAVWSAALAEADSAATVTAVDLPAVMPITQASVADAGLSDRYDFVAGDMFELSLPRAAFDLAIVANVCHLFGETNNRELFAVAGDALRPGGRVAIIDEPRGDMKRSRSLAMHELSLFARTTEGQLHPFSSYASWLHECGFADVQRHDLADPAERSLIVARRR